MTAKPWSARASASVKRSFQARRPWAFWAMCSMATAPGTPVARPLVTAVKKGRGLPSGPRNMSGEAPMGAVSRPL